jgi:FKBP-type peptidyl-prolyl cis-trans isomerase FkpA
MRSLILPAVALLVALPACLNTRPPLDPGEIQCIPFGMTQVTQRGDTVQTTTGLEFIELSLGAGLEAAACLELVVNVEGSLTDGTVFASTHGSEPARLIPGGQTMPAGLAEGLIGMRVGGERRLIVPSQLAYGPENFVDEFGNVIIPGGSTVIFDIELLEVNP